MCVWRNWQDFGIKQIEASRNKRKNEKKKMKQTLPTRRRSHAMTNFSLSIFHHSAYTPPRN